MVQRKRPDRQIHVPTHVRHKLGAVQGRIASRRLGVATPSG